MPILSEKPRNKAVKLCAVLLHPPEVAVARKRAEGESRARALTRSRLIDAAVEILVERGFAGTKIDEVVARAGYTRGAFYSNYSSMNELLEDAFVAFSTQLLTEMTQAFDSIEGPLDLERIIDTLESLAAQGRTAYILLMEYRLFQMRNPDAGGISGSQRNQLADFVTGMLESALERMDRRPLLPTNIMGEVLSIFYLEALGSVNDSAEANRIPIRKVVDVIVFGFSVPQDQPEGASLSFEGADLEQFRAEALDPSREALIPLVRGAIARG